MVGWDGWMPQSLHPAWWMPGCLNKAVPNPARLRLLLGQVTEGTSRWEGARDVWQPQNLLCVLG